MCCWCCFVVCGFVSSCFRSQSSPFISSTVPLMCTATLSVPITALPIAPSLSRFPPTVPAAKAFLDGHLVPVVFDSHYPLSFCPPLWIHSSYSHVSCLYPNGFSFSSLLRLSPSLECWMPGSRLRLDQCQGGCLTK